jgi:casein kinase II subunit beta
MSKARRDDREDAEEDDIPWITWWCSLRGNEFLCEVNEAFIRDHFNLTGLNSQVQYYEEALDVLLDMEHNRQFSDKTTETIQHSAEQLYGLVHARYILTARGLSQMSDKFKRGEFGCCPRVYCSGQSVVPAGCSDRYGEHSVKLFCPNCSDIYHPKSNRQGSLDGAFFGTTFPHMLFHTLPELMPPRKRQQLYVPRIFGFRIHASAYEVTAQQELLQALPPEQQQQKQQQPDAPVPQ